MLGVKVFGKVIRIRYHFFCFKFDGHRFLKYGLLEIRSASKCLPGLVFLLSSFPFTFLFFMSELDRSVVTACGFIIYNIILKLLQWPHFFNAGYDGKKLKCWFKEQENRIHLCRYQEKKQCKKSLPGPKR